MTRRLRKLDVRALDDEQRALYREVVGGPRSRGPQGFALRDEAGRLEGPFKLTTLVGYYATLALQLRVFRVPVPGRDEDA